MNKREEDAARVSRIADFIMKVVIMLTTVVALIFFAGKYNQALFSIIALIYLGAIIVKGIADLVESRRKE